MADDGLADFFAHFDKWTTRTIAGIELVADLHAKEGEAEMKRDAPWVDRTGLARKGLFGSVFKRSGEIGVRYGHTVGYGVYLEYAMAGKYAILKPTADRHEAQFMNDLKGVLG